jgi:hypothetical protein
MGHLRRASSSVLFAIGALLVFVGLTSALGYTVLGMLASAAAIVSLLFAGAVWFAPRRAAAPGVPAAPLLVFDRNLHIVSGASAGQAVAALFPEMLQPEIARRCATAINGHSARFTCLHRGRMVVFDALPVRGVDGTIAYGLLITTDAEPAAVAATA